MTNAGQAEHQDAEVERSLLARLLEGSRLHHSSKDYLEMLNFVPRLDLPGGPRQRPHHDGLAGSR
jgi:hypothetical protein